MYLGKFVKFLVFGGFKAFVTNVWQWRGAHSTGAVRMTSVVGFPHLLYKMVSHISTILVWDKNLHTAFLSHFYYILTWILFRKNKVEYVMYHSDFTKYFQYFEKYCSKNCWVQCNFQKTLALFEMKSLLNKKMFIIRLRFTLSMKLFP